MRTRGPVCAGAALLLALTAGCTGGTEEAVPERTTAAATPAAPATRSSPAPLTGRPGVAARPDGARAHRVRLRLGRVLARTSARTRYAVTYEANGLTISGVMMLVEDLLAGRGEAVPVTGTPADVQAEEDAHVVDVVQAVLPNGVRAVPARALASYARIHVMQTCRPQAAGQCASQAVAGPLISVSNGASPGPVTPPPGSSVRQGDQSCRARRPAALLQDHGEHNGGAARLKDLHTTVAALLVAHGCNTGCTPVIGAADALRYGRPSPVDQAHLRLATYRAANAILIDCPVSVPLARAWGGGLVASVGGMWFVPVRRCTRGRTRSTPGAWAGRPG